MNSTFPYYIYYIVVFSLNLECKIAKEERIINFESESLKVKLKVGGYSHQTISRNLSWEEGIKNKN